MTRLGSGSYIAEVRRLSSDGQIGDVVTLPVRKADSLIWGRRLSSTSQARITLRNLPIETLRKPRTLWHELGLYRDKEFVWSGPITNKTIGRDKMTLVAHDVSWWLTGRLPAQARRGKIDLATAVRRLLDDSHPGRAYEITAPAASGVIASVDRVPEQYRFAHEELSTLAKLGLEWTAVGGEIMAGAVIGSDTPRQLRFPALNERAFVNDVDITERGDLAATDVVVIGAAGAVATAAAGGVDDAFRRWVRVMRPDVASEADLQRIADAELAARWPAPIIIEVPEGSALSPDAKLGINHLIPGAVGVVEQSKLGVNAKMKLAQMQATVAQGREQIAVTMIPEGV